MNETTMEITKREYRHLRAEADRKAKAIYEKVLELKNEKGKEFAQGYVIAVCRYTGSFPRQHLKRNYRKRLLAEGIELPI